MSSNFYASYSSGMGGGGGGGSVSSVSVVTAHGFAGTVANPTSTPAITLSTTVTGILQGDGTSMSAATTGNLTDAGTDGITVTGGTGAVLGSGTSIAQHVADTTHNGYLSSTDWNTFNGKQPALTTGDLTDAGTDGITVTGGTGAVIGSGTSIAQHVADASHNGYLSSTDWSTFNNKQSTITTGNLTDAGTDGITVTGGTGAVIGSGTSIAQHVADASHNGYLSSTDWSTFNGKGAGSVTSVSSSGATGLTLTTTNPTTTPAIALGGTLTVPGGGTGLTSGTSGGVLAYTASGTLASSGALTSNAVVIGGGAGAAPTVISNNASGTNMVLTQVSGGTPAWNTLTSGDIPAATSSARGAISLEEENVSWSSNIGATIGGTNVTSFVTSVTAKYCRLGKMVFADFCITLATNGNTGAVVVTGLPYAANNDANYKTTGLTYQNQTGTYITWTVSSGSTSVPLFKSTGTALTAADISPTGNVFNATIIYRAS